MKNTPNIKATTANIATNAGAGIAIVSQSVAPVVGGWGALSRPGQQATPIRRLTGSPMLPTRRRRSSFLGCACEGSFDLRHVQGAVTISIVTGTSGPNSLGSNTQVCSRIHIRAHSHISAEKPPALRNIRIPPVALCRPNLASR